MFIYTFTHEGHEYSLNISNQSIKNEETGKVQAIEDLRDLSLIRATRNRLFRIKRINDHK